MLRRPSCHAQMELIQGSFPFACASGLGGALADAVDSLPALLNRKRMLEQHTNVLQAVMQQVAARHVPTYFELEKQIVAGTAEKAAVFELLNDAEKGHISDKLRLAEVYLLHCPSDTAQAECVAAQSAIASLGRGDGVSAEQASEAQAGVATLQWLGRYLQSVRAMSGVAPALAPQSSGPSSNGGGADKWAAGLSFFNSVAEKVRNVMARCVY